VLHRCGSVIVIDMKRLLLFCLLLLWPSLAAIAQKQSSPANPRVQDVSFPSKALGRDARYRVLLPRGYEAGGRFPVLYLLHGLYGDYLNWDTRTDIENYTRELPLLVVMPDAGDSWYVNSASTPAAKFEDYFVKDLIVDVNERFHTIRNRNHRAIAGLSMGGYGAIKFALKYPDLFEFAGSLSGALNAAQNLDDLRPEFRLKLVEVFGPANSQTRTENDVFRLAKAIPTSGPRPHLYLACGNSDFFLATNRAFAAELSEIKLDYEYHETAGGHSWEYWDASIQPLLGAAARAMDISESMK
jgi:putative tributyrin esterase